MYRRALPLLLILSACVSDPAGPEIESLCLALVRHQGVVFVASNNVSVGTSAPTQVIGEVTRQIGCDDTPGDGQTVGALQEGDSNFLAAGTKIYRIDGFATTERIAVKLEGTWIALVRN